MSWLRNVLALFATAALLFAPHLLPASIATQSTSYPVATAKVAKPLVQGVVVDQFGRYVDGVQVRVTLPNGKPVAAAESYASEWEDGPQHGYFFAETGRGTFTVTLSKSGYETVEYDDIEVTRRGQRVSLGEIQIDKVLAATSTTAALARQGNRAAVVVAVTTKATNKPTGVVEIREKNKVVGSASLKAGNRGTLLVSLGKLGKGGHVLRAYFLGSTDLAPSSSKRPVTLVVGKPKK